MTMRDGDRATREKILERLRPALERWYDGDPFGYAELFAERLTYFDPRTDGTLKGIDELRSHYTPIEGLVQVPRFELVDPSLQVRDGVAVFTYNVQEFGSDGSPGTRWNATEVYHRSDDRWEAIHAHWSPIPGD